MSEALKLWLRESWELWYWAMFFPSRLLERMNEWSPNEKHYAIQPYTSFQDILLLRFNWRFLFQFIQITCCLSLPIASLIFINGQNWDWLLLPIILLISYGIGIWTLQLGFHIPLIFTLFYVAKPTLFINTLSTSASILPPYLSQLPMGIIITTLGLIFTSILGILSFKHNHSQWLSRRLLISGSVLSCISGSWVGSQNWLFTTVTAGFIGLCLLLEYVLEKEYFFLIDLIDLIENGFYQYIEEASDNILSLVFIVFIAVFITTSFVLGESVFVLGERGFDGVAFLSFIAGVVSGGFAGLVVGTFTKRITERVEIAIAIVIAIAVAISTVVSILSSNQLKGYQLVSQFLAVIIVPSICAHIAFIITKNFFSTIVAGVIAICFSITVAEMVIFVSTSIRTIPLPIFVLLCWLVGTSISPLRQEWALVIAGVILSSFRFVYQGWETLIAILVILIGYNRIFPDFVMFSTFSLSTNSILQTISTKILYLLPPFTSELLCLPLPNHDRLLISAFRQNPLEAIPIFQAIQKQPIYGFQQTIKNALPQLVADQLIAIQTIPELIATATPNHAILPLLVPSLYQSELVDTQSLNVELLPTFQKFAQNTDAALQAGSIALRERGLERILDQLSTLNSQLSGLVKSKAIPRWQNVIKHWQTIIQQELEQLQRQSQGEILNPFQYGNPLTRDRAQLFKGRSAFADQIVRQILDRNRPTIILHGPRRCGKSSFLLNLPRLLTSDVLPVYIDLQSQSASQSEADFCFTIVRAIHRDARSQQVPLPAPPKREEFRLSPYTQLEDWLVTALTQLGDRRILLNIDEFEAIGTAMDQGRISTNLFDELRSLIQHWDRLSFLFSGVQTLDELGTNWSSYFISAMPIEMTYLNPNEARELLLNPDPEFTLEYDTGIVDQILSLTRCHPYLLQLLGWVLVQLANTTHTQLVTPTLLQSAIPEAYINGIGYFTNVWEQFTGTTPTEITAGQQQLLALAQGQQPHPTNESAQKSLQRMLRYHIIEKIDNQYKFEVPLIERWVREKAN